MNTSQFRTQILNSSLSPPNPVDYDIPTSEAPFGGRTPFFVGGNNQSDLPPSSDGTYTLGINPQNENASLLISTAEAPRILVNGNGTDQPPEYQGPMDGKVLIPNLSWGTESMPAMVSIVMSGLIPPEVRFIDLYLERSSNLFEFTVTITMLDNTSSMLLNNIFSGVKPPGSFTTLNYGANVVPEDPLVVDNLIYILKVNNPLLQPVNIEFTPNTFPQKMTPTYPTITGAPYTLPPNSVALFQMLMEPSNSQGLVRHFMLGNVINTL